MNYKIQEIRTMTAEELRSLCIRKNWYTRGTNEEYENLLSLTGSAWEPVHLTTEKLAEIATDIMCHSDMSPDYDLCCVMYELARACTVCFNKLGASS